MNRSTIQLLFLFVAGALLALGAAGCGTAQADPLEVTYYYLPG